MDKKEKQKKVFTIAGQVSIVIAAGVGWVAINYEQYRTLALIITVAMIFDAVFMFYMATANLKSNNTENQE